METTSRDRLVAMTIPEARADRTYPPGTIGVVSADLTRYASFTIALLGVKYPHATDILWQRGCDIVNSCNRIAREMSGDWVWYMGDDHAFDPNILVRLLSRMYDDGCDLVAPLCLGRQAPFPTVAGVFDEAAKQINVLPLQAIQGLQKVDVVGSAGLLVRKRVFEALADPWFEAGSLRRNGLGEDWYFCVKARKAGFQVYVDADIPLGHTTAMTLWPYQQDGVHGVRLDLGDGHNVMVQHVVAS